jgi:hypothetical protein
VRPSRLVLAAAVLAFGTATALAATDPHDEQVRLVSADTALARRTTLKTTDLASGWKRVPVPSQEDEGKCPGFDPDFSAFTITGKARSLFARQGGAVLSVVEVYKSRTQAVGDFRTGAKPALARCLRHAFETDFARETGGRVRTISSRMAPAPRVGERTALYRLVGTLTAQGRTIRIYMDFLAFQRGRSITVLFSSGFGARLRGQTTLARRIATRMR